MDTAHSPNATSEFGLVAPKRGNPLVPFLVFVIVFGLLAGTGVYIFLSGLSFTDIFHLSEEQGTDTSQDVVPPAEDQSDEQADTSEIQNDAASACEEVDIDCADLLTDETVEGNWTYVGTTVFEYSPEFTFLSSAGLLKSNGSSGLSVAIAGYDYEFPLHFSDGLTRTGNGVSLGGNVYDDVTIRMGVGTEFSVTGSGDFHVPADATFGWVYAEDVLVDDLEAGSLDAESVVAGDITVESLDAGAVTSDSVNISTTLFLGAVSLGGVGSSNITSGASVIGVFDEFSLSDGTTVQEVLADLDSSISSMGDYWVLSTNVLNPTSSTYDFAIGGTTLAASMFGIDEDAGNFYFGYDNSANPTFLFEATDADAGSFGFNTNDAFYFSDANVGIGTTSPTSRLHVYNDFTPTEGQIYTSNYSGLNIVGNADITSSYTGIYGKESNITVPINHSYNYDHVTLIGDVNTIDYYGDGNIFSIYGQYINTRTRAESDANVTNMYGTYTTVSPQGSGNTSYLTGGYTGVYTYADGQTQVVTDITGISILSTSTALNSSGSASATNVYGGKFLAGAQGQSTATATAGSVYGLYVEAGAAEYSSGNASITDSYDIYLNNGYGNNAGDVTNAYGLYIENITHGNSLNFAIYSAGGTNYFAGNVGIGTSDPGFTLDVDGTTHLLVDTINSRALEVSNNNDAVYVDPAGTIGIMSDSTSNSAEDKYGIYTNAAGTAGIKTGIFSRATGAGTNYGFFGDISGGTIDWGIYLSGEDKNYFSGKIGIGTTMPEVKLHVTDSTGPQLRLNYSDNVFGGIGAWFEVDSTGDLVVNTMRCTGGCVYTDILLASEGGSVGIGTTGPGAQLDVYNGAIELHYNGIYSGAVITMNDYGTSKRLLHFGGSGSYQSIFLGGYAGNTSMSGDYNVAMGYEALTANTGGDENTAMGFEALYSNTTGDYNTAIGYGSLYSNQTGSNNTALGESAGSNATGSNNTLLGYYAGVNLTSGSNNIIIGSSINAPSATGSNQMYLGGILYGDLSTGSIGIGTTGPGQELDVQGDIQLDANGAATTNGLCHSGANSDTTFADRDIVACSAAPGDIAEWYDTGTGQEGDIVVTTGKTVTYDSPVINALTGEVLNAKEQLTASILSPSTSSYQQNIIGVISTSPYQTFGRSIMDHSQNPNPVALTGRVPVKVSSANGAILPGDPITTSNIPGVGMKATQPGVVIGRALAPYSSSNPNEVGKILVFMNISWYQPESYTATLESLVSDYEQGVLGGSGGGVSGWSISENTMTTVLDVTASSMSATTGTFSILKTQMIDVGNGAFHVDVSGNVDVAGDLVVAGVLSGRYGDLTVSLGDTAGINKFRVVDSTGKEVFSVDSSGVVTASEIAVTSDENRTMGRGTISSGARRVTVSSAIVSDTSQIIVTFGGDYSPASRYWFESIVPGESFDVVLDQNVGQNVPFVWWVVNQE